MSVRAILGLFGALAFLLSAAGANAGSALPGNQFAQVEHSFFLTGETGGANGQDDALLLSPTSPEAQGQYAFVLPGVSVLGVLNQPSSQAWSTAVGWDKDREATTDSVARLYFVADVQAVAIFEVRLYDVAPDGTLGLIGSDEQQFITALSPTAVDFALHTTGIQMHKDHVLRLDVFAQTLTAVIVLQHGGDTPSAIEGLRTRWLDSDGDGVPDSDEVLLGRNPLNPNDPSEVADEGTDTDGDGLSDRTEATIGTDPDLVDSDGDGFGDGLEVYAGTNPRAAQSKPYDANHNGLPDSFESNYFNSTTVTPTTEPCSPGLGCIDPFADPDGDGCNNLCEAANGTNPNDADSDDDGVLDGDELEDGTDPNLAASLYAGPKGPPSPVAAAGMFALGTSVSLFALLRRP
ncbi:MAG: hypothetical protein WC876_05935 [Candidatus Thermoplasmatota archaeon]